MEEAEGILKKASQVQILQAVLTLAVCCIAVPFLKKLIRKGLGLLSEGIYQKIGKTVEMVMNTLLYAGTALLVLNALGVPISSLLTLVSVLSLALTLAVQGVLSNVAGASSSC